MTEEKDPGVVANVHYGGEYRGRLEEAARKGECPFCEEMKRGVAEAALHYTTRWWVKHNPYPPKSCYPPRDPIEIPAAAAFLIIPFAHITEMRQLLSEDWAEVSVLFQWMVEEFKLPGGVLGFRWGTPLHSGRTLLHLHFHVIVPPSHPTEAGKVAPVPFWAG